MASSVISNIYNPPKDSDLTFHFNNPVSFSTDNKYNKYNKYWLVLEASYADSRGFWRNEWQNATANTNPYLRGEAAKMRVKVTNGIHSYTDFTVEPNNDWYMKIGLEQ